MKNRDAKMRERYLQKEDDRLFSMIEKKLKHEKEAFYGRTDKDELQDEMYQRLLNLAKEMQDG